MQFVPVGLMHSHDDHSEKVAHSENHDQRVNIDQADHTSTSDFHFVVADDCDLCDLLLSLHNQSISFGSAQDYAFDFSLALVTTELQETAIDGVHLSTCGRAPPKA